MDAGTRANGPADRPVPGGVPLRGHVRASARLLLQRQAALAAHVRRSRQPRHYPRMYNTTQNAYIYIYKRKYYLKRLCDRCINREYK